MAELSEQHKLFARNLLKHKFNQTKAYIETYPDSKPNSAKVDASRLLTNANLTEYIQQLVEEQEKEDMITVEWVIKGIKETIGEVEKPEAKYKGYELLGKYLKMFTDRIEGSMTVDIDTDKAKESLKKAFDGLAGQSDT
jgi:phage terminase small subunit